MRDQSRTAPVSLLLKNELRLWWRQKTGVKNFWVGVVVLWVFVAFVSVSFWFGFAPLRQSTAGTELPVEALWVAVALWLLGSLFAFNQAISEGVVVLFERGDLDLLLSSPVSSRAVFTVRLLSVAISTFFSFCLIVVPISLFAVLVGFPQLVGMYPALMSICLIAASVAMLVTLRLVRWIGARRARGLVQVLNLFVSLIIILAFQVPNFLLTTESDLSGVQNRLQAWTSAGGLLGINSWVWFPGRAVLLDSVSVVMTLGLSGAIAAFTVYTLDRAFVEGSQQSVTHKRQARTNEGTVLKDGFFWVVLRKEWRTMRRHPYLISQVALQVVLILPLTWVILRGEGGNPLLDLGRVANVAMPFLGGQLAHVLTFVCLSGEEAADLLKSSPVEGFKLRRLKQLAALIPVWLLFLPAIALLIWQGYTWLPSVVAMLGASIGSSFFRLWNSKPIPPGELFKQRRMAQTDFFLTMIEVSTPWVWVGLGSALYAGSGSFVLISIVVLVVLFSIGYWRGRHLGSALQY